MSFPMRPAPWSKEKKRLFRQYQEEYLARHGWVRLVERADIWVNLRHYGVEVHSVYTFWAAWAKARRDAEENKQAEKRRLRLLAINSNPAAIAATAARGSGQQGDEDHG